MVLEREGFAPRGEGESRGGEGRARFARPEDLGTVMDLQRGFQLEYFGVSKELEEEFARLAVERMAGDGIVVAEEEEGGLKAKAETMVRTRRMGLIGGVYTRPEYRGRGLAGECMSLLCARLLRDYEAAVLTVALHNLPALKLYRGLGFRRAADFRMAVFP
jgi:predicted GNAT family acetyltransferase